MELIKLELKGFRGFKTKQVITFPKDKTPIVFVGINGAGKTSLLDAIRIALRPFYGELLSYEKEFDIETYNIHIDRDDMEVALHWKYTNENDTIYQTQIKVNRFISPKITVEQKTDISHLAADIKSQISLYKQHPIGIMVYYPSDRLVPPPEITHPIDESFTPLSALFRASDNTIDFKAFFKWFRLTEDIENEQRLTNDPSYTEPKLQAVKNAILAFLDNFSELRIQRSPVTDMVIKKEDKKLSVNQLSSGEKSILTMVGDLARRLAIANPGLPNPLEGRAVVLIDEVDLHLHPRWQKEIVAKLKTTFPNVQFILTTHSPLVINHLQTESIFLLDNFECYPAKQTDLITYAADLDILLAWQGLKGGSIPQKITQEINSIAKLINSNNLEEAKKQLMALKELIDPNHSEIKNIETILEVKELGL